MSDTQPAPINASAVSDSSATPSDGGTQPHRLSEDSFVVVDPVAVKVASPRECAAAGPACECATADTIHALADPARSCDDRKETGPDDAPSADAACASDKAAKAPELSVPPPPPPQPNQPTKDRRRRSHKRLPFAASVLLDVLTMIGMNLVGIGCVMMALGMLLAPQTPLAHDASTGGASCAILAAMPASAADGVQEADDGCACACSSDSPAVIGRIVAGTVGVRACVCPCFDYETSSYAHDLYHIALLSWPKVFMDAVLAVLSGVCCFFAIRVING